LLSIDALKQRNLNIKGIIYNGGNRLENIDFIENYSSIPTLGIIPELEVINKERISIEAAKFVGLSI
jgi:dethiobiotin synthetase